MQAFPLQCLPTHHGGSVHAGIFYQWYQNRRRCNYRWRWWWKYWGKLLSAGGGREDLNRTVDDIKVWKTTLVNICVLNMNKYQETLIKASPEINEKESKRKTGGFETRQRAKCSSWDKITNPSSLVFHVHCRQAFQLSYWLCHSQTTAQDDAFNKMPANESHDITPQNYVKLKRAIHCKAIKIVIVVWPAALIT